MNENEKKNNIQRIATHESTARSYALKASTTVATVDNSKTGARDQFNFMWSANMRWKIQSNLKTTYWYFKIKRYKIELRITL